MKFNLAPHQVLLSSTIALTSVLGFALPAQAMLRLGVGSTSYFNAGSISRGEISYSAISAAAEFHHTGETLVTGIQVQSEIFVGSDTPGWFEAPEAYVGAKWNLGSSEVFGNSQLKARIGRVREEWSEADRRFDLGLWEPLYRSDLARPIQAGLLGGFVEWKNELFEVTAFASPIFIPDRGSPIEVRDGKIDSKSPWFVSPPSEVTVLGTNTPIHYNLDLPSMGKIILHGGAGAQARVGKIQGAWGSVSYAYKPVNRLMMAVDGYLGLGSNEVLTMTTLHPRVIYHHLLSLDTGYKTANWQAGASFISECPVKDETPANWTIQDTKPAQVLALTGDYAITGTLRSGIRAEAGVLLVQGGDSIDVGIDANGGTRFESRFLFRRALMAGLKAPIGRFLVAGRATYDVPRAISLMSLDISFSPARQWWLTAGADLLGSGESAEDTAKYGNSISRYRANDRVHAGVSYVF